VRLVATVERPLADLQPLGEPRGVHFIEVLDVRAKYVMIKVSI
jgi:hypothetical protein